MISIAQLTHTHLSLPPSATTKPVVAAAYAVAAAVLPRPAGTSSVASWGGYVFGFGLCRVSLCSATAATNPRRQQQKCPDRFRTPGLLPFQPLQLLQVLEALLDLKTLTVMVENLPTADSVCGAFGGRFWQIGQQEPGLCAFHARFVG